MSAIEQSLRRALVNGDAGDPQFRRRIYEAALRAHDRLVADRGLDAEAEADQRERLLAAIKAIEAEHPAPPEAGDAPAEDAAVASVPPVEADDHGTDVPGGPAPQGEFPAAPEPDDGHSPIPSSGPEAIVHHPDDPAIEPVRPEAVPPVEPVVAAPPVTAGPADDDDAVREGRSFDVADAREEPPVPASAAIPAGVVLDDRWRPGAGRSGKPAKAAAPSEARPRRSRGRFLWIALAAVVALLILAYLILGLGSAGGDVAAPPEETSEAAPAADGTTQAAVEDDWIDVFSGDQLQSVTTPDGGLVEAVSGSGDVQAVRIEGPQGSEGVEIMIGIGPGLIGRLAGHTVRGEVTVGTPDENPREFGVRCIFDGETACGRQRFSTALPSESFVFDMEVPADPGDAASLAIDPGLASGGRNLDLYSVRMRILD